MIVFRQAFMKRKSSAAMVLAALGIVYGDIGTSPLYTLKETFLASHMRVGESSILGFVSLIIWALILVVTLKYVVFILHADDKGEGGVVVLMQQAMHQLSGKWAKLILLLGLAGTAMFFGDAMITPAVSVLSAAEGLTVINPELEHWVLPIALAVIAMLFYVQRKGTQHIGAFFGPVMLLWFGSLAAAGVYQIMQNPGILRAVNPYHGLYFATHHGWMGFVSLGAVVLAVTGAEALYADMGHFGRKPIQTAWLSLVLPALALNYIGQGALLLRNPAAIKNPFFMSMPEWALIPMIVLATAATVIASQAVISGAFSLSRQAVQLGFLPRLQIHHTSETEIGQIYIPSINWMLLVIVILVVLGFKNSTNLASAYGIAATGTMVLTTIMFCVVMLKKWRWPKIAVFGLTGIFLTFDLAFFSSNLLKLPTGGWFPVLVAGLLVFTFSTWRRGRALLEQQSDNGMDLREFVNNLTEYPPQTVSGNAVYMAGNPNGVPRALLHNLKHNKVLHEHNFLLTIKTLETPRVANEDRLKIEPLGGSFTCITAFYGFKETPRIRRIMDLVAQKDIELEMADTSFFLSRDSIRINEITPPGGMNRLRARWFKWLYKNSTPATDFYRIPDNRAVELGSQRNL